MAKLYISEYQFMGASGYDQAPIPREPCVKDQAPVDFTSGAASSSAFTAETSYVRLWSDADCCVAFGPDPTATTASKPLAAKTAALFGITPGDKVSVVALG